MRSNAKARQSKSKARLAAYDEMMREQESARGAQTHAHIAIPPGPRLGSIVLEVDGLEKEFGDKVLFKDLTFRLPPNGIVGVIGPNGAGKSTLFKMITGQETPDAGKIRLGDTVKLAYVDQSRDSLDPAKTIWQEISGGLDVMMVGKREVNTRSLRRQLQLQGRRPAEEGGPALGRGAQPRAPGQDPGRGRQPDPARRAHQRPRHRDASEPGGGAGGLRRLRRGDQPHDRWFLDRLATHILAFEGDSHVEWFEGNFEAYEEDKKRRLGADSLIPKRIKFQKFARA